jgi:HSP20 family protein
MAGLPARPEERENDMTVMTNWELFEDLRAAQDEFLRTNPARLARPARTYDQSTRTGPWAPPVDISEREDAYLVAADLPGIAADDVDITFEDGVLTIQGERREVPGAGTAKVHRAERQFGPFRRSITVPSHVEADKIKASAQDGTLLVRVPKAHSSQARRIAVATGGQHDAGPPAAANGSSQV